MSGKNLGNALDLCESFLVQARQSEKEASLKKKATDPSDPTAHPVMRADDGTQKAREGSRSAENEADIRAALGNRGVTGQSDANSAKGTYASDSIGTKKLESSEMGGNANQPKSEKDLPPESKGHPSNVTGKYAELINIGNRLSEALANIGNGSKQASASATPAAPAAPAAQDELTKEAALKYAAAQKHPDDAVAGYMAADMLLKAAQANLAEAEEKQAAAARHVEQTVEHIVKTAQADADMFCDYLAGHQAGLAKAAEGEMPAELAGEIPPGAVAAAAPEEAPAGEGGENEEEVIQALAQALEEAGVTPEELAAAVAQAEAEGGGAGAGAPMQ